MGRDAEIEHAHRRDEPLLGIEQGLVRDSEHEPARSRDVDQSGGTGSAARSAGLVRSNPFLRTSGSLGGALPLPRCRGGGGSVTGNFGAVSNSAASVTCWGWQSTTRKAVRDLVRPASSGGLCGVAPALNCRFTNENVRWTRSAGRTTSTGGGAMTARMRSSIAGRTSIMRRGGTATSANASRSASRSTTQLVPSAGHRAPSGIDP